MEYEIWYLGGGDTGVDVRSRFGGKGGARVGWVGCMGMGRGV